MSGEEDVTIRNFRITRKLLHGQYKLGEIFSGLDYSPPIHELFGDQEIDKLRSLDVEITDDVKYMRVSDLDGRLLISPHYIRRGRKEFIYLDLIHELTHIRQYLQGYELYDTEHRYIDRPTELEAFAKAIAEARRIGLSELEIYEYLKVDWISDSEHKELAERLGIASPARVGRCRKIEKGLA